MPSYNPINLLPINIHERKVNMTFSEIISILDVSFIQRVSKLCSRNVFADIMA